MNDLLIDWFKEYNDVRNIQYRTCENWKRNPKTILIVTDILFIDNNYLSDIDNRHMLLLQYKSQSGRWFLLKMKWFKQENISKI